MSDKQTFEQMVALLADKPSPMYLAQHVGLFYAGLQDLAARVANLEHAALEAGYRLTNLEDASNQTVAKLNAIETQHTEYKKRVEVVEQAPAVNDKKIADLEARIRTCEGAIGSANLKKPDPVKVEPDVKEEPAKPFGVSATPGAGPIAS